MCHIAQGVTLNSRAKSEWPRSDFRISRTSASVSREVFTSLPTTRVPWHFISSLLSCTVPHARLPGVSLFREPSKWRTTAPAGGVPCHASATKRHTRRLVGNSSTYTVVARYPSLSTDSRSSRRSVGGLARLRTGRHDPTRPRLDTSYPDAHAMGRHSSVGSVISTSR